MSHKCWVTASLWGKHTLRMCSRSRNVSVAWWKEHNPNPSWRHFYMCCFSLTPLSRTWSTSRSCVATRWMGRLSRGFQLLIQVFFMLSLSPNFPSSSSSSQLSSLSVLLNSPSFTPQFYLHFYTPSFVFIVCRETRKKRLFCFLRNRVKPSGNRVTSTHSKPDSYYVLSEIVSFVSS